MMKKRIVSLFLTFVLLCMAVPYALGVTVTPGDVNFDGSITAADARLCLRRAVGLENYISGSAAFIACDVDENGAVTAADARLILRTAVGLPNNTFPSELIFHGFYFPLPDGMTPDTANRTEDFMSYTGKASVCFYYLGKTEPESFTERDLKDFGSEHNLYCSITTQPGSLPFHAITFNASNASGSTMSHKGAVLFHNGNAVLLIEYDQSGSFSNTFYQYLNTVRGL